MSRLMDIGVIQMPFDMVIADEVSMLQFYNRANAILNELLELEAAKSRHAAERDALVEALTYYAENRHWYEGLECFGSNTILREYGDKARAALALLDSGSQG
jgi:hypothetical protein